MLFLDHRVWALMYIHFGVGWTLQQCIVVLCVGFIRFMFYCMVRIFHCYFIERCPLFMIASFNFRRDMVCIKGQLRVQIIVAARGRVNSWVCFAAPNPFHAAVDRVSLLAAWKVLYCQAYKILSTASNENFINLSLTH